MIFNKTINVSPRNYHSPTNFRLTNFIFKKPVTPSSIQINCIPRSHNSFTLSPKQTSNPEFLEKNCTNFMKGYIDKLKRERKRKNKQLKSNPRANAIDQFYNPKTNNALIFERISLRTPQINNIYQNEKVSQLIREIKKSKKNGQSLIKDILNQDNQRLQELRNQNKKLSPIHNQIKILKKKSNLALNFNKLQPWKNDVSQKIEFSIQSYYD